MRIKFWKIALSIIGGILIFIFLMNVITNSSGFNDNADVITPSIFYTGIFIIVLSIAVLCTVIINCTARIIKEVKNR